MKYAKDLIYYANKDLGNNQRNQLTPPNITTPSIPTRYYLKLVKKANTDEPAVYFHYDDELYSYIFKGRNRNIGDRRIITKYGVDVDNVLNLFVMAPPRDSLTSPTFKTGALTGVFLGNAIKLAGFYPKTRPAWEHRGNLNHEVGHALGLHHAWLARDGCEDTRAHSNKCWTRSQSAYCDTMTSNNVMDYNAHQNAWTPCQIGRVHARLSDPDSRQRKWLTPNWCQPWHGREIVIDDQIVWNGGRDLRKTIRIQPGARLRINARTHLARKTRIIVEPGGRLELGSKAYLHNICGQEWDGIVKEQDGEQTGLVLMEPGARIENAKG
ncbi:MAG: M43 family zinc metalloprotease [Bacteroidota bacterium]